MILPITIRPAAQDDLDTIAQYSERHWGRGQTRRYLRNISKALNRLAGAPSLGSDHSYLMTEIRRFAVGSHHIYYRVDGSQLVVIRILHQRMDAVRVISDDADPGTQ